MLAHAQLILMAPSSCSAHSHSLPHTQLTAPAGDSKERLAGICALCRGGVPVAVLSHLAHSWPESREAASQAARLEALCRMDELERKHERAWCGVVEIHQQAVAQLEEQPPGDGQLTRMTCASESPFEPLAAQLSLSEQSSIGSTECAAQLESMCHELQVSQLELWQVLPSPFSSHFLSAPFLYFLSSFPLLYSLSAFSVSPTFSLSLCLSSSVHKQARSS